MTNPGRAHANDLPTNDLRLAIDEIELIDQRYSFLSHSASSFHYGAYPRSFKQSLMRLGHNSACNMPADGVVLHHQLTSRLAQPARARGLPASLVRTAGPTCH